MTAPVSRVSGIRLPGSLVSARLPVGDETVQRMTLAAYGPNPHDAEVVALVHRRPDADRSFATVRIHSACFTGDVLGSLRCDCGPQLQAAIQAIGEAPFGVLLYFLNHEGRGIGLLNKIRAYGLQDEGLDTVDANLALGLPADQRNFRMAPDVLRELGVRRVRLLTNNPRKVEALRAGSLIVEEVAPLEIPPTPYNASYLEVKRQRLHAVADTGPAGAPSPAGCVSSVEGGSGGPPAPFRRHLGPVTSVASVPHTDLVVSAGYDGAVATFDTSRHETQLLGYHDHLVNSVTVDDAGIYAATCSSDFSIRIWDLARRRLHRTLLGHADDVEAFVFLDSRRGASASRDRRILVWSLDTGAILRVLEGHEKDVLSLAYRDGVLLSSGDDKTLRRWDPESGRMLSSWGPFEAETDTCAIDRVHGRLILGCDDGRIRAYSIESGELSHEIEAHRSGIKRVAVSTVTGQVVSAAYDQRVRVWGGPDLEWQFDLGGSPPWERSLTWSHDGARLLGGTFDGTLRVWEGKTGRFLYEIGGEGDEVGNACFNDLAVAGSGRAALVSDDGRVRTLRISRRSLSWEAAAAPSRGRVLMNAVAIDRRGRVVAGGAHDHRLHLWHAEDGQLVEQVEVSLGEGPINTIQFWEPPDGEPEVFAGCYSGAVARVGLDGQVRKVLRCHEGAVKALRLLPDRELGLSCAADGSAHAWDLEGRLQARFVGHNAIINDLDAEPGGSLVASVSRDFTVKVYELDGGRLVESIELGRRSLKCVCFFDARNIFIGDYWGHLIHVDLLGGRVRRRRVAFNGISALKRADEELLACSYDGSIYRVDARSLEPTGSLEAMCQRPQPASFSRAGR